MTVKEQKVPLRLHDWNGDGLIEVGMLPRILRALLQFRTGDATQQMVETALREGFI